MDLLKTMTPDNLQKLANQAFDAGDSDLVAMVVNELLRRDHSAHEETDPIHHLPGAIPIWHPREPRLVEKPIPRLWPERATVKPQPVAPHNTAALIAALNEWQDAIGFPYQGKSLLEKAIEQLRWYAETRAAEEVGY